MSDFATQFVSTEKTHIAEIEKVISRVGSLVEATVVERMECTVIVAELYGIGVRIFVFEPESSYIKKMIRI